jgi:hypothetical protein
VSQFIYYFVEYQYAECRYAEYHYAECRYAECCYAEYRHAECRGALVTMISKKLSIKTFRKLFFKTEFEKVIDFVIDLKDFSIWYFLQNKTEQNDYEWNDIEKNDTKLNGTELNDT